jgi:biuret amidohydrolase
VNVLEDCCASPDPELHRIECEKILPLFGRVMASEAFLATL